MKMKKTVILCFVLLVNGAALADVLGFSVGAQYWNYDVDGQVKSPLAANDFVGIDFADNNDLNFYVAFEHPVPFLPNLKLQQNNIQAAGLIPVSDDNYLNGQEIPVMGDIDLTHTDLMLYYELLDNWVNLDLGLSIKYFNGYSQFKYESLIDDKSKFDDLIPMLYAKAQFDLPLTGFSVAATAEALSFDSNKVTDIDLALKYQNKIGFGADLGYRVLDVDLKNINNFKSDLQVDGFYLGGHFEF
jgi:outer membrane protein